VVVHLNDMRMSESGDGLRFDCEAAIAEGLPIGGQTGRALEDLEGHRAIERDLAGAVDYREPALGDLVLHLKPAVEDAADQLERIGRVGSLVRHGRILVKPTGRWEVVSQPSRQGGADVVREGEQAHGHGDGAKAS
jgi:hypothetical protein